MFPEGKTSQGQGVRPFKSSLLEPAVRRNIPVHYATIRYSAPSGLAPASQWVCWGTSMPFGAHVTRVLRQPGFEATLRFGPKPIAAPDRKLLTRQLYDAVVAQFVPVD
jgi:hypothetical protein